MVFNSLQFLPFAVLVMAGHFLLPWKVDRFYLLLANYLFYASFNPPFVVFLALTTAIDWLVGKALYAQADPVRRKWLLVASIVVNLSILAYFKYVNFFLESLSFLGITVTTRFDIVIPLGISFYIFHSMSYTFDIYRGRIRPSGFIDFALFVSFFTQLVAGPIVRARHFLPQLAKKRLPSFRLVNLAAWLVVLGYFKKIVIADNLADFVGTVFASPAAFGPTDRVLGLLGFATQIYCDFSGYTDIAIGMSLLFGIRLRRNFRLPYLSQGITAFWQRWHISLSTWIRDYLYFSLGGNRRGPWRNALNVLATMSISGLWHGAGWMFFLWGLLHGVYILVERGYTAGLNAAERRFALVATLRRSLAYRAASIAVTFLAVLAGWVLFRSASLADARLFFGDVLEIRWVVDNLWEMAKGYWSGKPQRDAVYYIALFLIAHAAIFVWREVRTRMRLARVHWSLHPLATAMMVFAIVTSWESTNLFIYFQF